MEQTRSAEAKIKTRTLHLEDVYIVSLLWGKKNISSQACAKRRTKLANHSVEVLPKGVDRGEVKRWG